MASADRGGEEGGFGLGMRRAWTVLTERAESSEPVTTAAVCVFHTVTHSVTSTGGGAKSPGDALLGLGLSAQSSLEIQASEAVHWYRGTTRNINSTSTL